MLHVLTHGAVCKVNPVALVVYQQTCDVIMSVNYNNANCVFSCDKAYLSRVTYLVSNVTLHSMSRFKGKRHLESFDVLQSDVQWIHTFHVTKAFKAIV